MVWHRLADDEWELRLASESNMPQLQYSSSTRLVSILLCITLLVLYIYSRNTAVVLYNSSYYTLARVLLWIICILCILRVVLEYESVILLRARMREY